MNFELSIRIARPPEDVFAFLRDKDRFPQKPGSPVVALDRLTPGPTRQGTRYREVVRMLPFLRGRIDSEITRFEPPRYLEEDFRGSGMAGHLAYEFVAEGPDATRLIQRETIHALGLLALVAPLMWRALAPRLHDRLVAIKSTLEAGWSAVPE